MNLKNKLDDKYEEELFENVDYDYDSLSFYLHDLGCSGVDISCDESQNDDVLNNLCLTMTEG